MTVRQMIAKLILIEDKDLPVLYSDELAPLGYRDVDGVDVENDPFYPIWDKDLGEPRKKVVFIR